MESILAELAGNRELLSRLRRQGISYARERLTWDAKAQDTTRVLNWAVRRGPKPNLPPPKELAKNPLENDTKSRTAVEVGCE
jgi:hypothetical protein